MKSTKILQIENLDLNTLIGNFNFLKNELYEIKQNFVKTETEKLLTRDQTADYFNVSTVTIWQWTKKNLLKSYKIANKIYYKQAEIETALTEIKA